MGRNPFLDRDFDSLAEAERYYHEENAENNEATVPDYYIYAEQPVLVDVDINPPRDY